MAQLSAFINNLVVFRRASGKTFCHYMLVVAAVLLVLGLVCTHELKPKLQYGGIPFGPHKPLFQQLDLLAG